MKKNTFLLLFLCFFSSVMALNPITQAMMNVYAKLIAENPEDYETLFRRANEYYKQGEYALAKKDIDDALRFAPGSDSDLRGQAYALRANISLMDGDKQAALQDFGSALAISPNDFAITYQKAMLHADLGQLRQAADGFRQMQRINPRSTDALFGLARVEIKQQNFGSATELMNRAVEMDKTNPEVFLRRANLRRELGNTGDAVNDILIAISLDTKNTSAFRQLVDLSKTNYAAVVQGLSDVISQAPDNGMYRFIRATLAMEHNHYNAAMNDFNEIVNNNLYDYHGIYRSMAFCEFNLGNNENALDHINRAISMTSDNASYHILKSRILIALDNRDEAVSELQYALVKDPDNQEAVELLTELGRSRY